MVINDNYFYIKSTIVELLNPNEPCKDLTPSSVVPAKIQDALFKQVSGDKKK